MSDRSALLPARPRSFAADGLLRIEAAVAFSGLSETALWDLIRERKVTSGIPEGTRRRLISKVSLIAWLDANTAWDEGSH